jgi:CRISPR-associated protein Csa1
MVFYTMDDVLRILQTFQDTPVEVSEELRGWRWKEPPLLVSYRARINVSDLTIACGTGRLAYLRHHRGIRERPGHELMFGSFVHRCITTATSSAKEVLFRNRPRTGKEFHEELIKIGDQLIKSGEFSAYPEVFETIWQRAALTYSAALDKVLSSSRYLSWDGIVYRVVPWICEFPVDGRNLGFNRAVRIDALIPPNLIVEFKTRKPSREFEVALAGYALCFESQFRVAVNHAVILYLEFSGRDVKVYEHFVAIDDELRLELVERRDMLLRVVSEGFDPGLPERCDPSCPYLRICNPENPNVSMIR